MGKGGEERGKRRNGWVYSERGWERGRRKSSERGQKVERMGEGKEKEQREGAEGREDGRGEGERAERGGRR